MKEEMRKKKLEDDKGNFDFSSFRQYEESVLPIILQDGSNSTGKTAPLEEPEPESFLEEPDPGYTGPQISTKGIRKVLIKCKKFIKHACKRLSSI